MKKSLRFVKNFIESTSDINQSFYFIFDAYYMQHIAVNSFKAYRNWFILALFGYHTRFYLCIDEYFDKLNKIKLYTKGITNEIERVFENRISWYSEILPRC